MGLGRRREDNGVVKVDAHNLRALYELIWARSVDHGFGRPRWTRELSI